jgi:hypothetical protein
MTKIQHIHSVNCRPVNRRWKTAMPMTAYARLMQMRTEIEKIKAVSGARQIASADESDLLPERNHTSGHLDDSALLPGEKKARRSGELRPTLN